LYGDPGSISASFLPFHLSPLFFFLLSFFLCQSFVTFVLEMKKITKRQYIKGFFAVVIILLGVRLAFPDIAKSQAQLDEEALSAYNDSLTQAQRDSIDKVSLTEINGIEDADYSSHDAASSRFFRSDGSLAKHPIFSVSHFGKTFPDLNDVQLASARKYGVEPVQNRKEAEKHRDKLVYVGSNPYYSIDELHSSIPYLVPRAAVLLQDIGRSFYDSLQIKGIPLHKIIVTSVLRSKDDVVSLRKRNGNASEHSCHMFGTTFDICYNRYNTVQPPGEERRKVRNDSLKWVLSEVLRDFREANRCYIKYEIKQGCFHITVR